MGTRRTSPLTADEIYCAALALIDAEGIDALSMRRLARELDVEAMSLYHHVPNKTAVLDGVVELSLKTQASTPPSPGAPWQDTVVEAIVAFRRALVAHPNVLPHMIAHPPSSAEARAAYIDGPLRFLVDNGLGENDAGHLFEAVFALSFGHALLTTNYPPLGGSGVPRVIFGEPSFRASVETLVGAYVAPGAGKPRTPQG